MPVGIAHIHIHRVPDYAAGIWCHAVRSAPAGNDSIAEGNVRLMNEAGEIAIEISGIRLRATPADALSGAFYKMAGNDSHWRKRPRR